MKKTILVFMFFIILDINLYSQTIGGIKGSSLTVVNTLVCGNDGSSQTNSILTYSIQSSSLSSFKDVNAATKDTFSYYLSPTSTLRNAGNNISGIPTKDLNGNDRTYDTTIDIGPVEYSQIYLNGTGAWNAASGWNTGRIPIANDIVTIRTAASVTSTDAVCKSIIAIESGASLTINPAAQLIVSTTLNNTNPDRLIIKSSDIQPNGTLIFHNTANNPYATVWMFSKATWNTSFEPKSKYQWQFFGIPVQSVEASPTFDGAYVRKSNEAGKLTDYWIQQSNASILNPFLGYEICQASATNYQIQGQLVNSDFTNYATTTLPYTSGAMYPGQNIFANPYTAAIDINKLTFGDGTEHSVYLYNTGSYNDWLPTGGSTPGDGAGQYTVVPQILSGPLSIPTIPSMQGFLIKVKANSGVAFSNANFSINYASVVTQNTLALRAPGSEKVNSSDFVFTKIDVTGAHFSDRMWLFSDSSCTHNFDNGWDGAKMMGSALSPQIYAIESDGNYQVDAVDDITNTQLGFQAGQDENYMLTFTHQNLNNNYSSMFLFDMVENKTVDITESGSTYSFAAASSPTPVKRFIIATQRIEKKVTGKDNKLTIFGSENTVFVDNSGKLSGEMIVYDMMGRILKKESISPFGVTAVQVNTISGNYIVTAATVNERVSKRIIIVK